MCTNHVDNVVLKFAMQYEIYSNDFHDSIATCEVKRRKWDTFNFDRIDNLFT